MSRAPDGPWYYEQTDLGYNYRMTDVLAALGASQMRRLGAYIARRHELAQRYDRLLADLPVTTPWQHPDCRSATHLYIIRLQLERLTATHRQVFERMRAHQIGVNLHYIPLYHQPYYQRLGLSGADYPQSERYYAEAMSLPLFPALTEEQQYRVVSALRDALG
jgi:dTDP-4-amino-4,6-dideoxygalactose transaminase